MRRRIAGKLAVEAVDRVMRGEGAPSPIYEGEDGVIAWMLDGPDAEYQVPLPEPGEPKRAILDSYTKEHSRRIPEPGADRPRASACATQIADLDADRDDRHPHQPPHALRDRHRRQRSAEDGPEGEPRNARSLDHVHLRRRAAGRRLAPRRQLRARARGAADTVELWHKIETVEDPEWTRRYHSHDPKQKAFGGRVEIVTLKGGSTISDEIAVANAHPLGARPFGRPDYIRKFRTLTEGIIAPPEQDRFLAAVAAAAVACGRRVAAAELCGRPAGTLGASASRGIFDWQLDTQTSRVA